MHKLSAFVIDPIIFVTVGNGALVQSTGSGEGTVNLGILSNSEYVTSNGASIHSLKDSFTVSTVIGVKADLSGYSRVRAATLRAYLLGSDPLRAIWMDGVRLSANPTIITKQTYYGIVSQHTLKIEVPASMPAGQLMDLIEMVITPN